MGEIFPESLNNSIQLTHYSHRIAFGGFFILLSLFGGAGNLTTCWYMFLKKKSCQMTLKSLLIADTMACLVSLPLQSFRMFQFNWIADCHLEAVGFYITVIAVWASCLTICIIAFDRYTLLTKYKRYHIIMTKKRVKIMLALVWLVSVVGSCAKFVPGGGPPVFRPINGAMLLIPVILLPIFYYGIVKHVHRSEKRMETHKKMGSQHSVPSQFTINEKATGGTSSSSNQLQSKKRKVARRSALLVGWFFICSCTCIALMALLMVNRKKRFLTPYSVHLLSKLSYLSLVMNSCLNPVIYFLRDAKYQRTLKELFCGGRSMIKAKSGRMNEYDNQC